MISLKNFRAGRLAALFSGLVSSIVILFLFLAFPVQAQTNPDLSREKILFTVGYAHLDTQWRWDYQTTIREYLWKTMVDNFSLFEKYPHYVFNFSGANRYRLMNEYYPEEYKKVKDYVAQGRWFPAGSSLEENDVMAPSAESIIRQVLYGTHYFRQEFGFSSREYILPDCFGFPASLPSILAHCGLKGFSTQKLSWGSAIGIPFNLGIWSGPDGQSVVAALNPGDYVSKITGDLTRNETWMNRVKENGQKYGVYADYMYYGTGDVGGAPDENSVINLEKSLASNQESEIKIAASKAEDLFVLLTAEQRNKLPAYQGEFLLTNHSAGSITSQAAMKRWNRKNEFLGYAAEAAAVMAAWSGAGQYDQARLNEAWRLVLGAQFHDILPGTSVPRAYEFSWNDEILAANQFEQVLKYSAGAVICHLDTRVTGRPLVVYNPLAFSREDIVEAEVEFPGEIQACRVFGPDGLEAPSQIKEIEGNRIKIVFLAKVPPVGYSVYDVRPSAEACSLSTGLKAGKNSLENLRYVVKINRDGDVSSIYDKKAKKELLVSPAQLSFHQEKPQQWPAWNMDWEDRMKPPAGYVEGPAEVSIVENGPARIAIKVERESKHSKFVQIIRLSAGEAGDRLEWNNQIDWATPESSLKAVFPLTVANSVATYNWEVGTIKRGNNDPKKFEVPSHLWFDLTDKSSSYGVSILEDCKYGSDKPADHLVRLTLLYTPGVRSWPKEQATQDFGRHEILYALYGHQGDWRQAGTNEQALRLNQPLIAFTAQSQAGVLGKNFSFLTVEPEGLRVLAIKKAENSKEIIIRVVETRGRAVKKAILTFAFPIKSASEVNGVEDHLRSAQFKGNKLTFDLEPNGLKSFALDIEPFQKKLAPAVSRPVDLPYNLDVFSFDHDRSDGAFEASGWTYPAELIPDSILVGNQTFQLGPKFDGAKNAVACEGQVISLPPGNFNRLYLLAAASEENQKGLFKIGQREEEFSVGYWSGFIGQWDNRLWAEGPAASLDFDRDSFTYSGLIPGYIRGDELACCTTHLHQSLTGPEGNEPYIYGYIFKYEINLPPGAKEIVLPSNKAIKIFALVVAFNESDEPEPAQNLFDTLVRQPVDMERWAVVPPPVITPATAYVSPSQPASVSMTVPLKGAEIHYTLDSSEPTVKSLVYRDALSIGESKVLKARAFHPVRLPGPVATGYYSQSLPVVDIIYFNPPAKNREGAGEERTLIDLIKASEDVADKNWQGFEGEDLKVVLDLGQKKDVYELELSCAENNNARIFLPVAVKIELSVDGQKFETMVDQRLPVPAAKKPQGPAIKRLDFSLKGREARYIRLTAASVGRVPEGFHEAGQKAWLVLDEIYVR
ncbi:MAG: glycoside hydrolase family 38 C-terminal domain-containing protein [Acidobacteriota bacterium]|nr:glycoside hydrolase family 38 C-terminal domain-containing protein [Acidobacteriota bacterium]